MQKENKGQVVWHPLVHKRFSEELHYYRISTATYSATFKARLSDALTSIGANGFSIYEIFGNFDILLRVWLTSANRERFETNAKSLEDITRIDEFLVQEFDVLYNEDEKAPHTPSDAHLVGLTPQVVLDVQTGGGSPSRLDDLFEQGITLSRNRAFGTSGYKFLVLMTYPSGVPVSEFEISDSLSSFIQEQELASQVCVCSGIGFTKYLISGIVQDFHPLSVGR